MPKRTIVIFFAVLCLTGCTTLEHYDKSTGISEKSGDVMFGVRIYQGRLPAEIRYESLGIVKGEGSSGMAVQKAINARIAMLKEAKKLGANAVINLKPCGSWGTVCLEGEAVKTEEFPDVFILPETVVSYENSKVFNYDYEDVFETVKRVLEFELYDLDVIDKERGIIETKEIEVSPQKMRWTDADAGGPYPILKIKIVIEEISPKNVKVTEVDSFRGEAWKEATVKKNSNVFFKEIFSVLKE